MKRKINGEKILKKVPVKAGSNSDIDNMLITDKNIYAITVTGKSYWDIREFGLTKEDIEDRYGVSISID